LKKKQNDDYQVDPLLTATKFILDFYYGEVSFETINNFTPKKGSGFDDSCVIDVISNLGLHAITRDINGLDIPDYFLPCIIKDEFNHPVVYLRRIGNEVVIYDTLTHIEKTVDSKILKDYNKAIIIFRESHKKEHVDKDKKKTWFYNPIKSFW